MSFFVEDEVLNRAAGAELYSEEIGKRVWNLYVKAGFYSFRFFGFCHSWKITSRRRVRKVGLESVEPAKQQSGVNPHYIAHGQRSY
jgi:hypothetical protein